MNTCYDDILSRIKDPPIWWDEYAVPRWCEFHPNQVANIYASKVVLLHIECQNCSTPFKVAMSCTNITPWRRTLEELEYGDPPNSDCCGSGPSMSSVPIRVLEFWDSADPLKDWTRVPANEIALDPIWNRETNK